MDRKPLLSLLVSLFGGAACAQSPGEKAPGQDDPSALLAIADEVAKDVEKLRGLSFKRPVPKHVRTKEEIRAFVRKSMDKELPPAVWGPRERFYKGLGLLPKEVDLRREMEEVLVEQVGGFYDPDAGEFVVAGSFGPTLDRFIVAHELTHALDDQHFDLKGRFEEVRNEEDRSLALGAVVEGSGMLVAQRYLMKRVLTTPEDAAKMLEEAKGLDAMEMRRLRDAPLYLQRALLLPYLAGMSFLQRGIPSPIPDVKPADFKRAFTHLPRSSEQVLHPEKYWEEPTDDEPIEVSLPDLSEHLGSGWKLLDSSTLGEALVAVLVSDPAEIEPLDPESIEGMQAFLAQSWTNEGAEGWGGDRFAVYGKGESLVGVWLTVWDAPSDAEEFERAWRKRAGSSGVSRRENDRVAIALADPAPGGAGLLERLAGKALRDARTRRLEPPEHKAGSY